MTSRINGEAIIWASAGASRPKLARSRHQIGTGLASDLTYAIIDHAVFQVLNLGNDFQDKWRSHHLGIGGSLQPNAGKFAPSNRNRTRFRSHIRDHRSRGLSGSQPWQ